MFTFRWLRQIKARTWLTLALCCLLVALPVAYLIRKASLAVDQGGIYRVRTLAPLAESQVIKGSGLDLAEVSASNLLVNGAFEPFVYRKMLQADGGSSQEIYLAVSDQLDEIKGEIPLDDFFAGANFEVYSTRRGQLRLKKSGFIQAVRTEQPTDFQDIALPPDSPSKLQWYGLGEIGPAERRSSLAYGEGGYVAYDLQADLSLLRTEDGLDLITYCPWGEGGLLLNQAGQIYTLNPAAKPQLEKLDWPGLEAPIKDLACLDQTDTQLILALDREGQAYLNQDESFRKANIRLRGPIERVFSEGKYLFVQGQDQSLYASENGQQWTQILPGREQTPSFRALSHWQDCYLRVGENGHVEFWHQGDKEGVRTIDPRSFAVAKQKAEAIYGKTNLNIASFPDFEAAEMFSDRHFLLLDAKGHLYESRDGGQNWDILRPELTDRKLSAFYLNSHGVLLAASQDGRLGRASMNLTLVPDRHLEEESYLPGDMVRLTKLSPLPWSRERSFIPELAAGEQLTVPTGDWYCRLPAKAELVPNEQASLYASYVLSLTMPGSAQNNTEAENDVVEGIYSGLRYQAKSFKDQPGIKLSYQITPEALKLMQNGAAFELNFRAKADNDQARVDLSLTGPGITPERVRRYLTSEWQDYSAIIVLPWPLVDSSEMNLQFLFQNCEQVFLDDISLTRADQPKVHALAVADLQILNPDVLRLSALRIGSPVLGPEFYYAPTGRWLLSDTNGLKSRYAGSLKEAAELTESGKSLPWFCLERGVTEPELRHLMQYLFGNRQTEYGQKRVADGNLASWNEIFDQVYLEFVETGDSEFRSDAERKAFVEWAMAIIRSTNEYEQVADQLVFIDGMCYEGGVLLSEADAHAYDLRALKPMGNVESLRAEKEHWATGSLREPLWMPSARPELVRSISGTDRDLRLADYMLAALDGLGQQKILSLPSLTSDFNAMPESVLTTLVKCESDLAGAVPLTVQVSDSGNEEDQVLQAFAFRSKDRDIIFLLNLSHEARLVRLDSAKNEQMVITEYNPQGEFLNERGNRHHERFHSVLPGGMLVFESASD
ncbi:MAG: hypothetical protein Q4E09_04615 [Eubacteriales bacterium]|nr:hypothetical protein [Eubacteriales bacterium]